MGWYLHYEWLWLEVNVYYSSGAVGHSHGMVPRGFVVAGSCWLASLQPVFIKCIPLIGPLLAFAVPLNPFKCLGASRKP
jgi:hypothetical protein